MELVALAVAGDHNRDGHQHGRNNQDENTAAESFDEALGCRRGLSVTEGATLSERRERSQEGEEKQ